MSATLITLSFHADLEMCRLLCRSVDEFAPDIRHRLYVPRRDLPLFASLATNRRVIETQESLLPSWFWKAPLPGPAWRKRLGLPRRNLYLTPFTGPVRGWIAQQIMKIAATLSCEDEIVAHVDSDAAFVRTLAPKHFERGGRVRFYAGTPLEQLPSHTPWYAAADRLFGLAAQDRCKLDYIDHFVVWRRSVVEEMVARIETVTARPWRVALAQTSHFSEYVLYGIFADHVLGVEKAGLFTASDSLCHVRWTTEFTDSADEVAFARAIGPNKILCSIQSTISISPDRRVRLLEAARATG